jgi:diguanylate cyclase (GGDEF)-like protein
VTDAALPRVLVADDEPANILLIAHALKDECEIVQVSSGTDVLERVVVGDIDLILLDVVMPGLDGFEICKVLKSSPFTSGIPVIFVTALDQRRDETRGLDVGAVDYITKPIHPAVVKARVHAHLELKKARDLLEQLASVDPLTGVANRRRFDAALEEEWRRVRRAGRWLSLAIADVDHFKQYNDRHGHLAGDERLRIIATALARSARRAGDLVARYGGEEFCALLMDADQAQALAVAEDIRAGLASQPVVLQGQQHPVTVSIGVARLHKGNLTEALHDADQALYRAKAAGRNRVAPEDGSASVAAS